MNLKVPFNTKAKVLLTKNELKSIQINGESFNQFKKENKVEVNKESIIIGSGNYNIEYVKF